MGSIFSKIPTSRLEGLTDGIFAVAMTILVLSIEAPSPENIGITDVNTYIISLIPKISMYFISFILLGCFWLTHHSFFLIEKIDQTLVWTSILWLMTICLIPFSVSLVANFGTSMYAELFFGINIFFIGLLYFINIYYAYKKDFFKKNLDFNINIFLWFPISIIILSIIDIVISIIDPSFTNLFYLLIPAFLIMLSNSVPKIKFFKDND
ncbi:TMEM175 family protein [Methanobrevibacter sp. DSM 116169]|uniref:TMEM175 family protein n=1 Tax=Methanobrevibacter sp. DSM 116169 TaxID=3242727 RepID=UPI0038FCBD8B